MNPAIEKEAEKRELLEMFLLNLHGASHAENKVMLLFNVPNAASAEVERYLSANALFGDRTLERRHCGHVDRLDEAP